MTGDCSLNSSETVFTDTARSMPLRQRKGYDAKRKTRVTCFCYRATELMASAPDCASMRSNQPILVQTRIRPSSGWVGLVPKIRIPGPLNISSSAALRLFCDIAPHGPH